MKLKRFEALNLQEALAAVKAELGSDAVIISTRRINKGSKFFGLLSQSMIEVTAAVDRSIPLRGKEASAQERTRIDIPESKESGNDQSWYEPPNGSGEGASSTFGEHLRVATLPDPVAQQLAALREEMKGLLEGKPKVEVLIESLRQELETIRACIGEALADRTTQRATSLPGDMATYYEALVSAGVTPDLAYGLVRSVVETLGSSGLANKEVVAEMLRDRMEQVVPVSGPLVLPGGLQKVVMLVGPTGVGKTTTVAKLASQFTQGPTKVKTVVVTLDTYRVAAVEQLRVYARILKVPVEVAVTPEELATCVARHRDARLILVDTAGRSPQDPSGRQELAAIAQQKITVETHLVLAAPTERTVQQEVVRRYSAIPIHRLLFTKLDEARQTGTLFDLIHHAGLPVSYLSAGQRVPEDLEQATSNAILDRMNVFDTWKGMSKRKKPAEVEVG